MARHDPYKDPTYQKNRARILGLPCVGCGRPSDTADHIIEHSRFPPGTPPTTVHALSNLQPMCRSCNSRKGARYVNKARSRRRRYRNPRY